MTTIYDGPAAGTKLMLKRTPIFLRVTIADIKTGSRTIDALNEVDDVCRPDETPYAYVMARYLGTAISRPGGVHGVCTYIVCAVQPTESQMRDNAQWAKWCESQTKLEIKQ